MELSNAQEPVGVLSHVSVKEASQLQVHPPQDKHLDKELVLLKLVIPVLHLVKEVAKVELQQEELPVEVHQQVAKEMVLQAHKEQVRQQDKGQAKVVLLVEAIHSVNRQKVAVSSWIPC